MKTICDRNQCMGCMACADICPKNAISIVDTLKEFNAVIDEAVCIGCNACYAVCQKNNSIELMEPVQWKQGWSKNRELRGQSSSGGAASAIANAFIKGGGMVCSCLFKDGGFYFEITDNVEEAKKFCGSKYVKSNPVGMYKGITLLLAKKKKVLFIGLPCQVGALKIYISDKLQENLYTIDLICHGSPSPNVLDIFLKQYNRSLSDLNDIYFRMKMKFMIYGNYHSIVTKGVTDPYSIAFLNSLIYTENCYECPYAAKRRVSDLTLGDSWGSDLPEEEQKLGISLILCMTEKGKRLLNMAELHLEDVDIENAIKNNHQLEMPSLRPKGRDIFFEELGYRSFNMLVMKRFPKQCIRQMIKEVLIKAHVIRGGNKLWFVL